MPQREQAQGTEQSKATHWPQSRASGRLRIHMASVQSCWYESGDRCPYLEPALMAAHGVFVGPTCLIR